MKSAPEISPRPVIKLEEAKQALETMLGQNLEVRLDHEPQQTNPLGMSEEGGVLVIKPIDTTFQGSLSESLLCQLQQNETVRQSLIDMAVAFGPFVLLNDTFTPKEHSALEKSDDTRVKSSTSIPFHVDSYESLGKNADYSGVYHPLNFAILFHATSEAGRTSPTLFALSREHLLWMGNNTFENYLWSEDFDGEPKNNIYWNNLREATAWIREGGDPPACLNTLLRQSMFDMRELLPFEVAEGVQRTCDHILMDESFFFLTTFRSQLNPINDRVIDFTLQQALEEKFGIAINWEKYRQEVQEMSGGVSVLNLDINGLAHGRLGPGQGIQAKTLPLIPKIQEHVLLAIARAIEEE